MYPFSPHVYLKKKGLLPHLAFLVLFSQSCSYYFSCIVFNFLRCKIFYKYFCMCYYVCLFHLGKLCDCCSGSDRPIDMGLPRFFHSPLMFYYMNILQLFPHNTLTMHQLMILLIEIG